MTELAQDIPFRVSENLGSFIDQRSPTHSEFVAGLKRVERTTFSPTNMWVDILVQELSIKANVPEGVRNSVIEYSRHHMTRAKRMRRREAVAALIYIFAKNDKRLNKSIREICQLTGTDRRTVGQYITWFTLEGGLKPQQKKPEEYLSWLGSKLTVHKELIDKGRDFIAAFRKSGPTDITPRSLAASALYLAARQNGHEFTQRKLAEVMGLGEYTVREDSMRMQRAIANRF